METSLVHMNSTTKKTSQYHVNLTSQTCQALFKIECNFNIFRYWILGIECIQKKEANGTFGHILQGTLSGLSIFSSWKIQHFKIQIWKFGVCFGRNVLTFPLPLCINLPVVLQFQYWINFRFLLKKNYMCLLFPP